MRGRAYKIAFQLRSLLGSELTPAGRIALRYAVDAMERADPFLAQKNIDPPDCHFAKLEELFDIDAVISFSEAWPYWEEGDRILKGKVSDLLLLDQSLFQGKHAGALRYFDGIASLARDNAERIAEWAYQIGIRDACVLDLGAGTGEHARAFVRGGVAAQALCVDFPFVVDKVADHRAAEVSWVSGDVRDLSLSTSQSLQSFNVVWISNVLHHYPENDCVRILRGIRPHLEHNGRLLIHEYLVGAAGSQDLAASIQGLHFALTTLGGRCFTRSELVNLVNESLGYDRILEELILPKSSVLVFGRGDNG